MIKEKLQDELKKGTTFDYIESTFAELADLLEQDAIYSNFKFIDGKRGKANIDTGTNWVILDIDKSHITDEEAHLLFSDINHHICRTSDPDNPNKFRMLIELNAIVDINDIQWRYFIEAIADELNLIVDILPKAQIYYSYVGRTVHSVTDAEKLPTKELIIKASKRQASKPKAPKLTTAQATSALEDHWNTFQYAFEAQNGEGSRMLIRAGLHAIDLGAQWDYVEDLVNRINDYWESQMDQERIDTTILTYLNNRYKGD